jgi:hypothetical protein
VIRPKLSLRRSLAVLGATFLGLTAALAVAAPASAHHSEVKVKADCETATGEWVVTWTVNSYAPQGVSNYKLTSVDAEKLVGETKSAVSIPGIEVTQGDSYPHAVGTPLVGVQRLPGESTGASLTVKAQWDNGYNEDGPKGASIKFSGTCDKVVTPPPATANPKVSVVADCRGDVDVTLENGAEATKPAKFTVTGTDGFTQKATVDAGKEKTVTVPAKNAAKITVTEEGQKEPLFDDKPAEAKDCVKPGEPAGSYQSTCDELIFEIDNPKDGEPVTATFTPNKGKAQTVTVAPGKTETVKFPASEGLTVTPSGEGMENQEPIAWEKPADCKSSGGGGSLPLTGPAAGGIAGGAAVLLAIGGGLFVMARRRRIRFTA